MFEGLIWAAFTASRGLAEPWRRGGQLVDPIDGNTRVARALLLRAAASAHRRVEPSS